MNRREAAARAQDRSTPEKRGGHTRRYLPPKKGEKKRGVHPPRIDTHTETVRKRLTKKSNLPVHPHTVVVST